MVLNPSNSSSLEQLALNGLIAIPVIIIVNANHDGRTVTTFRNDFIPHALADLRGLGAIAPQMLDIFCFAKKQTFEQLSAADIRDCLLSVCIVWF